VVHLFSVAKVWIYFMSFLVPLVFFCLEPDQLSSRTIYASIFRDKIIVECFRSSREQLAIPQRGMRDANATSRRKSG